MASGSVPYMNLCERNVSGRNFHITHVDCGLIITRHVSPSPNDK